MRNATPLIRRKAVMRAGLAVVGLLCGLGAICGKASADTYVPIDGDYSGSWMFASFSYNTGGLGMVGTAPAATSGLTSVSLVTEGPAPSGIIFGREGPIQISNNAGDYLSGTFPGASNDGATTSFKITGGTGPFTGAQGGGDLVVINYPSTTDYFTGPCRITLHGHATVPSSVPEPSSAALLAWSAFLGMPVIRRAKRHF